MYGGTAVRGHSRLGTGRARGRRYGSAVGFNPFRKQVNRRSDIVFVGAALLVVVVLLIWAAFPR